MNQSTSKAGDEALYELFERIFWGGMALSPMELTYLGFDRGEHAAARSRLDRHGVEGDAVRARHARKMLAEVQAFDTESLS